MVGLDAVIGRLYPVVGEPKGFVTPLQYQLLLGFSGLGPLIGNYGFGYLSDRYGRRRVMIAGCLCAGILYLPVAWVKHRSRLMLGGNILAWSMLGIGGTLLALHTLPAHPVVFVVVLSLIPIVIMVPVIIFFMPESPRWLEGHGRYAEADAIGHRRDPAVRFRRQLHLQYVQLHRDLVPDAAADPRGGLDRRRRPRWRWPGR